jgi:putative salt-induced outer membrane protein YdiY
MTHRVTCSIFLLAVMLLPATAGAQAPEPPAPPAAAPAPEPPPKAWKASLAAGLALTGGNTQTTTTNLSFSFETDKKRRQVVSAEGLNLRSSQDGAAIVDRSSVSARDQYALTPRSYVFGQVQYVRDVFKSIEYLVAPTAGGGVKLIDEDRSTLSTDVSVGAVFEKDDDLARTTSTAVTFSEKASHKLAMGTDVTQSYSALWSAGHGVLHTLQAGVAAKLNGHMQIKVDVMDTYRSRTFEEAVKKNDTALLTSLGFTF